MKTIGFIGCGNMGRAILEGVASVIDVTIYASNRHIEKILDLNERYGVHIAGNLEVAARSDVLFLAVKPNVYENVIHEICDVVKKDAIIIDIAAGITIQDVKKMFGRSVKVVKAMPNTPAMVKMGMTGISFDDLMNEKEKQEVLRLFRCIGDVEVIDESLMNAVGSASGSSPAFVYVFMEAMADACVALGMQRSQAYHFVGQAVKGSAEMMLESKLHPGQLKDMVCSPGGTTIEGIAKLEEAGFRNAVMKALLACAEKTEKMKK